MECTAPKVGNVTPEQSFDDLTYEHFVQSAPITAKWLSRASTDGVGFVIEQAAREIMETVGQNTHLGILLLLAPLAAAGDRDDLPRVLESLTVADAKHAYYAIRIMEPGGLGEAEDQDVRDEPTETLLECMKLAAGRDTIAKQYANSFSDAFLFADQLDAAAFAHDWPSAVLHLQINVLSRIPDTLIARKCGNETAKEATNRAEDILHHSQPAHQVTLPLAGGSELRPGEGNRPILRFDNWLRADGHRRNPGTTADMIAAILFVTLREGRMKPPEKFLNG